MTKIHLLGKSERELFFNEVFSKTNIPVSILVNLSSLNWKLGSFILPSREEGLEENERLASDATQGSIRCETKARKAFERMAPVPGVICWRQITGRTKSLRAHHLFSVKNQKHRDHPLAGLELPSSTLTSTYDVCTIKV